MDEKREIARLFAITLALGVGSVLMLVITPFFLFHTPRTILSPADLFIAIVSCFVLATPFYFLLLIHYFGSETEEVVPEHLSFLPNRVRKPWEVNLIFRDEPLNFDENGFFATILDLQRRRIIQIEPVDPPPGLHINILKREALDRYENQVLGFLSHRNTVYIGPFTVYNTIIDLYTTVHRVLIPDSREGIRYLENGRNRLVPWAVGASILYIIGLIMMPLANPAAGPVYPGIIISIAIAGTAFIGLAVFTRYLVNDPWMDRTMVHFVAGEILFIAILTLIATFVLPVTFLTNDSVAIVSVAIVVLPFIAVLQTSVALAASPALFGRWKPGMYREKLQWDAFRQFLSDFTSLERAKPEDVNTWGEWLVYGTALGVGGQVAASMRQLSVSSRETDGIVSLVEGSASLRKKPSRKP